MNARASLWSYLDLLSNPVIEEIDLLPIDASLEVKDVSGNRYPRVNIWVNGDAVASGDIGHVFAYPHAMHRILFRPFRVRDGEMTYSVTFYWTNGAWSSVLFQSADEMNAALNGTAAGKLNWPTPEAI